jgi:hypothetical protein
MNHATYHAPGASPKVFPCIEGTVPGTIDLLNAAGRVVVAGLPVGEPGSFGRSKAYGVLHSPPKLKVKSKAKESLETAEHPTSDLAL